MVMPLLQRCMCFYHVTCRIWLSDQGRAASEPACKFAQCCCVPKLRKVLFCNVFCMVAAVTEQMRQAAIHICKESKPEGLVVHRCSMTISTAANHDACLLGCMQGTCRTGVCVCKPGYRGTYCEVPPECGVILDVNGNCCNHGIISADGICCGPVHLLHMANVYT